MLRYAVTYRVAEYPRTIKKLNKVIEGFTELSCRQKAWHAAKKFSGQTVIKVDLIELINEEDYDA